MKNRLYKPLENRIGILITSSYLIVPIIIMLAITNPQIYPANKINSLVSASYLFLGLSVALHLMLGFWKKTKKPVLDVLLIVNALFAAFVVYTSGGTTSPFIILFYIQIIGVTLSISYRTGLKLVILHTILFFAIYYDQSIGFIKYSAGNAPKLKIAKSPFYWHVESILNISFLWIITGVTAFFSSINEGELKQNNRELAILNKTGLKMRKDFDVPTILNVTMDTVAEELGFGKVFISLLDSKKIALEKSRSKGFDKEAKKEIRKLNVAVKNNSLNILAKAIRNELPIGGKVKGLDEKSPHLARIIRDQKEFIVVPLVGYFGTVGTIVATKNGFFRKSRITNREVDVLYNLGKQAAIAIDNANLNEKLKELARKDSLTSLYNHGFFQEKLKHEISKISRYKNLSFRKNPLSLIIIDIDNFKRYNDKHGHPEGDVLLKRFAQVLIKSCRSFNTVCRYGGEEFAIILPNTNTKQSKQIAERIRKSCLDLNKGKKKDIGKEAEISCSLGITTAISNKDYSKDVLIKEADDALYAAKNDGKNQSIHHFELKKKKSNIECIS